jgi:methylglutaconyl-CoA hydratase
MPRHLSVNIERGVATVTLRRPEVHNALVPELASELTAAFQELGTAPGVRSIVLAAEGKSFCAGADIDWMRRAAAAGVDENTAEALQLAQMFRAIYECPRPVIGRVHGAAFGGGVGLVAVCDLVVALETVRFSFSEVKLGIIPAVISPFVLRKVPSGVARRYFLTAERFEVAEARRIGLIAEVAATEEALDEQVQLWAEQLAANGPEAMSACKRLLDEVDPVDWDHVLPLAARGNAERRGSAEGQEGIRAFLEKRVPAWHPDAEGVDVP